MSPDYRQCNPHTSQPYNAVGSTQTSGWCSSNPVTCYTVSGHQQAGIFMQMDMHQQPLLAIEAFHDTKLPAQLLAGASCTPSSPDCQLNVEKYIGYESRAKGALQQSAFARYGSLHRDRPPRRCMQPGLKASRIASAKRQLSSKNASANLVTQRSPLPLQLYS